MKDLRIRKNRLSSFKTAFAIRFNLLVFAVYVPSPYFQRGCYYSFILHFLWWSVSPSQLNLAKLCSEQSINYLDLHGQRAIHKTKPTRSSL